MSCAGEWWWLKGLETLPPSPHQLHRKGTLSTKSLCGVRTYPRKTSQTRISVALLLLWFCSAGRRERLGVMLSPLDMLWDQQGGCCRGARRSPSCFSVRWAAGNKVHPLWVDSFQKLPFGRISGEKMRPWKGSAAAGFRRCFSLPSRGAVSSFLVCASISDKISKQAELTPAFNYRTFHTDLGYISYGPHYEKEMILAIYVS